MAQPCSKCKCSMEGFAADAPEQFCPHMSDGGRAFTNFAPKCVNVGPAMSSFDKRRYLMDNAEMLINQDRVDLFTRLGCAPCYGYNEVGTALPEQAQVQCNDRYCTIKITNPCGVGVGRANTSLDVKFDRGTMEVPFYPIDSFPDGKYASCSRFSFLDTQRS